MGHSFVEVKKPRLGAGVLGHAERIIEKAGEVNVGAAAVVSAVTAYAKINASCQWIERTEQGSLNQLFDRMTREEMEAYAKDGQLPPWFERALGATGMDSHDDSARRQTLEQQDNSEILGATILGPGDFPLSSPESRRDRQDRARAQRGIA